MLTSAASADVDAAIGDGSGAPLSTARPPPQPRPARTGRGARGGARRSVAPSPGEAPAPPSSRWLALLGTVLLLAGIIEVATGGARRAAGSALGLGGAGGIGVGASAASAVAAAAAAIPRGVPARMIVVAGHLEAGTGIANKDLSWLLYWLPDLCPVAYDHANAPDARKPYVAAPALGREAPVYVRFILDHYDALPARTVFLHGDRSAWHDKDLVTVLRSLRWDLHYANLNYDSRYDLAPVGPLDFRYHNIALAWPTVFQPWFGALPPHFAIHCCAQFMASREAITSVPRAFWEAYYEYITAPLGDSQAEVDRSITVEHMWFYLLNSPPSRGAWDAQLDVNKDAELCRVLTVCPLPSSPPELPKALQAALRSGSFYPCGAAYPEDLPPTASPALQASPSPFVAPSAMPSEAAPTLVASVSAPAASPSAAPPPTEAATTASASPLPPSPVESSLPSAAAPTHALRALRLAAAEAAPSWRLASGWRLVAKMR